MNDILLIGNDIPTLQSVMSWLGKCFSMKDLGEDAYILGIKIYRDRSQRLLGLSQSWYIDKVLKRFSMQDSKRGFLPMYHGIKLSKSQCLNVQPRRKKRSPTQWGGLRIIIQQGKSSTINTNQSHQRKVRNHIAINS